ncbi:MAG: type II secretion system F family protein, partial [Planctomycetota bacterium]|nr:type II secretion system F family protein [Planctomycetota bacterium]
TSITVAAAFVGGILGVLAANWIQLGPFGIVAFAAAGAFLLSRFPQLVVEARWQARRTEVGDAMPLMLDMMHVSTSAGQSVDEAWDSVQEQMQGVSPALAEEMQLVSLEVRLGESRERALTEMAERTGVGDAAALASMLSQSERFGAGLSDTFRSQAESMRQDYARGMEERAHQSSIKALLPISLLMLPAMLLVSVVPFIIVTLRAFSELQ